MSRALLPALLVLLLCPGCAPPRATPAMAEAPALDRLFEARLRELGVSPAPLCTDAVFLRRVHLDVLGTLPTPAEVRAFLAEARPDKRQRLVDAVLERPEWAEYRGLKWGDLLRVKSEFPSNLWPHAAQAYDHWIREAMRRRVPYDRFVRDLLTASGSNFREPAANFYRAFQDRAPLPIARNVAQVFLGLDLDRLPEDARRGFAACFGTLAYKATGEWKEEIVFSDPAKAGPGTRRAVLPGGAVLVLPEGADPRPALAAWLTSPRNPWFARAEVNRVWGWLLGRGLIPEEATAPDAVPWSAPLLAHLERAFVQSGFDVRALYRLILTSRAYQLAAGPAGDGFACARIRRLDAEVLLDAIDQALGTGEKYTSPIPEPFTNLPAGQRAIALADGSIGSPFLELFGRPARNTSSASERSGAVTSLQAQHLLNATHIQRKLDQSPVLKALAKGQAEDAAPRIVETLYLRCLCRYPDREELRAATAHLQRRGRGLPEGVADLAWALLNTKAFQLRD